MKTCTKCQQSKPLEDFHKEKGGKFGVRADCKECNRSRASSYYRKNPQPYIERAAAFNKRNPENKRACDKRRYHERIKDPLFKRKELARSSTWKRSNRASERARWAKYNAQKLNATPKWANLDLIAEIYRNCPEGYEVDHIIPLQGKNVSGLHVEYNLQYLTRSENAAKGNRI